MFKIFLPIFAIVFFSGCASVNQKPAIKISHQTSKSKLVSQPSPVVSQVDKMKVENKGVVFGKTDFRGILKTSYVKLLLENMIKDNEKFQLIVGDKSSVADLFVDAKTVDPGYFFVELPVGNYKISSIAIPVGSTMAIEDLNIQFNVQPATIVYVGTLMMEGTKEKIRLGGVPVIQPGFEYIIEVKDESSDGLKTLKINYPDNTLSLQTDIMKVIQ